MTKSTDRVRLGSGEVMTLGEALDKGLLEVRIVEHFCGPRGGCGIAYFADEPGTMSGFRISPFLYRSRMGLPVRIYLGGNEVCLDNHS